MVETKPTIELTDEEKQVIRECLSESFNDAKELLKSIIEVVQRKGRNK